MSTTYSVVIDLKTVGSLDVGKGATGKGPEKAMSLIKSGWKDIEGASSGVMGVLDSAVDKMGSFAKAAAVAGGVAAMGAMYYGVTSLNSELESTKISLGTIFSANGIAGSVPEGMQHASDIIKTMRQDAKALPGEFEDLKGIFITGAIDASRAGASPEQWEKTAAKVMASAKVAQVPMEVASREFAQLMEGRAGAHNVLGTRLFGLSGASAKKFNAQTDAQRFAELSKTLDKYGASIDQFGQSFDGQSSSLVDNAKNLLRQTTEPLFEAVKRELGGINGWFEHSDAMISSWSDYLGGKLVDGFEFGKKEILLWGPAVEQFAVNAYAKLHAIWIDIGPTVTAGAEAIRNALKDPGTIDKIIHMLELWAGMKAVGAGLGIVGTFGQGIKGAADVAGGAKALWSGGGAAAGAESKGMGGGTANVLAAGIMAPLLALGYAYTEKQNLNEVNEEKDRQARDAAWKLGTSLFELNESMMATTGAQDHYMESVGNWAAQMDASGDATEAAFLRLEYAAIAAAAAMDNMYAHDRAERDDASAREASNDMMLAITQQNRKFLGGGSETKKGGAVTGGHGGTNIQKVEIVVTQNNSPSRVARVVMDELGKLTRNPRSSSFTRNYSSLEKG